MLEVLINPILPVFAILALGYLLGRADWMSVEDARVLNRFAMTIFVPILVFSLIARAPVHSFSAAPILGYITAQIVVFAGAFLLAHRVFQLDAGESVLLGFCSVGANNVFFGLPIALLVFGQPAVLPLTSIITLDATLSFALSMAALQLITHGRAGPLSILQSLAKVLHGIGDLLRRFRILKLEAADFEAYEGGTTVDELVDYVRTFGFVERSRVPFGGTKQGDRTYYDLIVERVG